MKLLVKTLCGSFCTIEAYEGMTVGQIKDVVAEKTNTVSQKISLIHSGKKWEMNDYKLTAQDLTKFKGVCVTFTAIVRKEPKTD